jgi:hypothetical protein
VWAGAAVCHQESLQWDSPSMCATAVATALADLQKAVNCPAQLHTGHRGS